MFANNLLCLFRPCKQFFSIFFIPPPPPPPTRKIMVHPLVLVSIEEIWTEFSNFQTPLKVRPKHSDLLRDIFNWSFEGFESSEFVATAHSLSHLISNLSDLRSTVVFWEESSPFFCGACQTIGYNTAHPFQNDTIRCYIFPQFGITVSDCGFLSDLKKGKIFEVENINYCWSWF